MELIVILFAIATFVSTLLGGLLALKFKKLLPYLFAFAAGSLIAVAFFDLLPESIKLSNDIGLSIKYLMLTVVLSFLFYSLLEKYFLAHHHDDEEHEEHGHILGPIGAGSLAVHSFLDGAAIGAAFQINSSIGMIVALAVIAHDFTDGINTVTLMLKNKQKIKNAWFFLFLDAIAPVLGVLLTSMILIPQNYLALLLSFFVGEFLYIGAANLLPETHKHRSIGIAIAMILAIILIFVITSLL